MGEVPEADRIQMLDMDPIDVQIKAFVHSSGSTPK